MTKTWTIVERARTEVDGFDPRWLPPSLTERIRVIASGPHLFLEVDGWVGSGHLLNGDHLRIVSKYGEFNYLRMLSRIMELPDPSADDVDYGVGFEDTPILVFGRAFARGLARVTERGVATDFRDLVSRSVFLPRRMDVTRTAISMRLEREPRAYGQNRERTEETPEHAVLGAAARIVADSGGRLEPRDVKVVATIAARWFSPQVDLGAAIRTVITRLSRKWYAGSRAYYVAPLRQALLILGSTGATTLDGSVVTGDALLTNSDWLFEAYVRKLLAESLAPFGYVVTKAVKGDRFLFASGEIALTPDILIRRGTQVVAIGDVKHKSPDPSDYYQTITYAREWGLRSVLILEATATSARTQSLVVSSDGTEALRIELPVLYYDILEERIRGIRSYLAA